MKREEKKAAKRLEIVQQAMELFEKKGFDGTTTEEIAAAAGIAKKTLFQYFPSKDDIVFSNENQLLELLLDWLASKPDDVWAAYPDFLAKLINADDDPKDIFNLPAIIEESPQLRGRLLASWAYYERTLSEHLELPELDGKILACRLVLVLRLLFEGDYDLEEILGKV